MPSDNYPYAVGRVRLLENALLDPTKLARLRELDYTDALRQLNDWGYAADYPVKSDPDALIAFRRGEVRAQVAEITPDPSLTDLFYLDADATNLKLLLKSRLLGGLDDADDAMLAGVFPLGVLQQAVDTRDYTALGDTLCAKLTALEDALTRHVDPRALSAAVDNAIFAHVAAVLHKNKNEFCTRYFTTKIDFINVVSVLRARALGWDETDLYPMLVPGGEVTEGALRAAVSADETQLDSLLASGRGGAHVRNALELYRTGLFAEARDRIDATLLAFAADERYDPFGIGPIAYYILASESECRALRVLFAKKRAGIADGQKGGA